MIQFTLTWGEIVFMMVGYCFASFLYGFGKGFGKWRKEQKKNSQDS